MAGLRNHCRKMSDSKIFDRCNGVVTHLEHSMEQVNKVNDMIFIEPTRKITNRAVLDPIGDIFGDVISGVGFKIS